MAIPTLLSTVFYLWIHESLKYGKILLVFNISRYIFAKKDYKNFRKALKRIAKINKQPYLEKTLIFQDELMRENFALGRTSNN